MHIMYCFETGKEGGAKEIIVYQMGSALARDLGVPARILYAFSNNVAGHYHAAQILRRDGGLRRLSIPDEALKDMSFVQNVSAAYCRSLRQALYYVQKFGVESHLQAIGSRDAPERYLARVLGWVNRVLIALPEDGDWLRQRTWLMTQLRK